MHIIVLGAGISGCLIAQRLARDSNYQVSLIDQTHGPALETSAHQMALVHPQVNKKSTKLQRFTQLANRIIWQKYAATVRYRGAFQPLIQSTSMSKNLISELLLTLKFTNLEIAYMNKDEAFQLTNVPTDGLWFKTAGIYDLQKISSDALNNVEGVKKYWQQKIVQLNYKNARWSVINENQEVVCT